MPRSRSFPRACFRLSLLAGHFMYGLLLVSFFRFRSGRHWFNSELGKRAIQAWMQSVCSILAIRIRSKGTACIGSETLFVANHVSWIDIVGLSSLVQAKFVAKDTVKKWPVIGTLASASGTLFIERGKYFSLNYTIDNIRAELDRRESVLIFPEGTTTDGWSVAAFHSALFRAVSDSRHIIQTIAIRYTIDDKLDELAPYIGEDNFVSHLYRIAARRETCLEVYFAAPFAAIKMDRHELARKAYADIARLLVSRRQFDRETSRRIACCGK